MELKMNEYQLPDRILFNYEELKQELTEKVSMYETLVYTDDQIKEAKADKANLNRLKKALNDERIRREREYMKPFNDFKDKINEIIGIIDKPVALIDKQVKEYEDRQKQEKMEQIKALWSEMDVPAGLTFEKVFDSRMLNVSYGMNHVRQAMSDNIKRFNRDMETLASLPAFGFEAQQEYIRTLDMNKALEEGRKMAQIAKAKKEAEEARLREEAGLKAEEEKAAPAEEVGESEKFIPPAVDEELDRKAFAPAKQWVSFAALLSTEDALALRDFFISRNIEFKAV